MNKNGMQNRWWAVVLVVVVAMSVGVAAAAGNYLVLDAPRPSDAILVLAAETNHRPERALQLLAQPARLEHFSTRNSRT
jgi:hypothetical protein